jgi:protein phosphatase
MTDRGRVRPINEDAYYLPAEGERFCAVADGMGGHNAGEVASALAVNTFADYMRGVERITADALRAAVARANDAVYRASQESDEVSGMGTTFSALGMEGSTAFIAHVGDSRVYLVRRGALMQVTIDHTLVEEMVLKGLLTVREARVHPKRNIITRALGTEPRVEIDMLQLDLKPGDVFFLCSDGLTNHVSEREILHAAQSSQGWQEKLRHLVGVALENGGQDNITAMFAIYEEADGR